MRGLVYSATAYEIEKRKEDEARIEHELVVNYDKYTKEVEGIRIKVVYDSFKSGLRVSIFALMKDDSKMILYTFLRSRLVTREIAVNEKSWFFNLEELENRIVANGAKNTIHDIFKTISSLQ